MNNDRAQLEKLGQQKLARSEAHNLLSAAFCIHCGRVYIVDRDNSREECVCGAEMYPMDKGIVLGEELRCADGIEVRAVVSKAPQADDKCDVCSAPYTNGTDGWGMRANHLLCPKCFSRSRP